MIGWIVLVVSGLIILLLLLLALPVGYACKAARGGGSFTISLAGGLYKKRLIYPVKEKAEKEKAAEEAASEEKSEAGAKIEKEEPIRLTADGHPKKPVPADTAADEREEDGEETEDTEEGVSRWAILTRAVENGAAAVVLQSLWKILRHSSPGEISFTGRMGLGDPMRTGILAGAMYAVFPKASRITWDYTDKVTDVTFRMRGRIIPLYIIYIAIETVLARPVRSVLSMKRRKQHGRRSKKETV